LALGAITAASLAELKSLLIRPQFSNNKRVEFPVVVLCAQESRWGDRNREARAQRPDEETLEAEG
jgi:hypothetical protein